MQRFMRDNRLHEVHESMNKIEGIERDITFILGRMQNRNGLICIEDMAGV